MNEVSTRVTLRDIAECVGVSVMTVSLALRGHPRISEPRRHEIRQAAEAMGYRPNAMASALAHQRRHTMSHVVSAELAWVNNWSNPARLRSYKEFDLCWRGAQAAAERHGFSLEEFIVDPRLCFSRLERIFDARNIQGIIIPPHGCAAQTCPDRFSLDWSKYSVVRLGYSLPDLPAHVVAGNHVQASRLAFAKMRQKGYERIGYICFESSSIRALAGFCLSQMDVPPVQRLPVLTIPSSRFEVKGLEVLGRWLRKYQPDAILSEMAETPGMLRKLGCRVPEDIALATTSVLDGNADAGIRQNSEVIGRAAVETLLEIMYRNETGLPDLCREVLVDSSWQDGVTLPPREPAARAGGKKRASRAKGNHGATSARA